MGKEVRDEGHIFMKHKYHIDVINRTSLVS
jgi:hypothetical protein